MRNNKQIPFRYNEEDLQKDLDELFKLQGYTQKTNEALIHAVKISASFSRKHLKKDYSSGRKQEIKDLLGIDIF